MPVPYLSRHIYLTFYLLWWGLLAMGQPESTDLGALRTALGKHTASDSAKVTMLIKYSTALLNVSVDSAQVYADQAKEIGQKLGNPALDYSLLMIEGVIHSYEGQENLGLNDFLDALEITRRYSSAVWKQRRFSALTNIGGIYYNRADYDKSNTFLKQAASLYPSYQIPELGNCYRGIAMNFLEKQQLDSARHYATQALGVYRFFNQELSQNQTRVFIAEIDRNTGKAQQAYEACTSLLPYFQQQNLPLPLAELHNTLGFAAMAINRKSEALKSFQQSFQLASQIGSSSLERAASYNLHYFFDQHHQTDSAYYYYKLFTALDQTLWNEEKNRAIANTEGFYQAKIKEQQNQLLLRENKDIQLQKSIYFLMLLGMTLGLIGVSVFLATIRKRNNFIEAQNRTLANLHEEVKTALEETNRLAQEKRHLISLLTHDLRAPLEIIQLNGMLLEGRLQPVVHPELEEIKENARLIHEFSLRIMAAQNIETLDIPIYLNSVNFDHIALYTIKRFQSLAKQKGIHIEWNPCQRPPTAYADTFFLRECLANLVSNAIRHTPEHGSITLFCHQEAAYAVFSVKDEGPGNPRFTGTDNPFIQPCHSTSGIGYGLYLTQRYIQLMGGKIRASNPSEGGALLEIFLPTQRR